MDLPTYTNIWRIEKRLYKLYDFRLPMPLPINWIAVFAAITVPYIVFLIAIGLPFNHTLVWLYVLPPGLLTWLTTRPVIENKRLPELVESQVRYLTEPRVWTRLAPHNEKDQMVVTARVWHIRQAPQPRKTAKTRAAMGAVALRERNALARRGVAATAIGDPAEGNAPLAAASALAAAPATSANSRSRARARGTGPRIPAPGPSGRQRPPGRRTRPPQQDWAAQQREAARHDELPEETWPAGQPPRAQTTGAEDQAAKPSRFRLSALRPRPAGQAPALPPGVALRRPAEPRRSRFGSPPLSDQAGSAQPWPEGPDRPGQAGPAWRMPAIRSAPPLGSVAAPMSSDLPAHATPDIYPASPPPAADVEPATSVHTAPDEDHVPSVHAAQGVYLAAPVGLASLEVATGTPVSATTLDGEPAMSAPAAPEVDPAALAPDAPETEPVISAPASSEANAAPSAPATPEVDPGASPAALDGEPATLVHVVPEVDQAEAPAVQTLSLRRRRPFRPRRTRRRPLPRSTRLLRPLPSQTSSLRPRNPLRPSCTRRRPQRLAPARRGLSPSMASRPRWCTSSRRSTRLLRLLPPQTLSLRPRYLLRLRRTRCWPPRRLTRARHLPLLTASRPRGCTSSLRSTRPLRLPRPRTSTRPRPRAAPSRRARRHRRLPRLTLARRRPDWATCGQPRRLLRRAARRALRYRMTGRPSGLCRPRRSRRSTPPWRGRRRGRSPRICPCFLLP